jgi:hypothetical protein
MATERELSPQTAFPPIDELELAPIGLDHGSGDSEAKPRSGS